jgi:hypothetical protein
MNLPVIPEGWHKLGLDDVLTFADMWWRLEEGSSRWESHGFQPGMAVRYYGDGFIWIRKNPEEKIWVDPWD